MKDAFKRKSTLLVCIGFVLYVVSICAPSVKVDASKYALPSGLEVNGFVEFICVIANKRAVFVLSVIQTVVSVFAFALTTLVLSGMENDGKLVSKNSIVYLPVVACALLLIGGIVFRKENAVLGGAQ